MSTGLVFLQACGGDDAAATGDDETGGPTSLDGSATDESSSDDTGTSEDSDATDPTAADDTSSAGDSDDTGPAACDAADTCSAPAPIGWNGPIVYARVEAGGEAPPCPDGFPEAGPTVLDGFVDPGPAVCTCECSVAASTSCSSQFTHHTTDECTYTCYYYGPGGYCYAYGVTPTFLYEDCTNLEVEDWIVFHSYYSYMGGGMMMSQCNESSSETIPEFAWAASIATCKLPETALQCADGVCIPPPPDGFEAKWCLYQTGDLDCPAGPYPNKTTFWSDVMDDRGCTGCNCGAAPTCDDAELHVFDEPDCGGAPSAVLAPDTCTAVTGASLVVDFDTEGACAVEEDAVAQGEIVPTGAFTFCCSD